MMLSMSVREVKVPGAEERASRHFGGRGRVSNACRLVKKMYQAHSCCFTNHGTGLLA